MKMSWEKDKITNKQKAAIGNMQSALDWNTPMPATKGEASRLISKMKDQIETRLSMTGYIKAKHGSFCPCVDCEGDVEDPEDSNEEDYFDDIF